MTSLEFPEHRPAPVHSDMPEHRRAGEREQLVHALLRARTGHGQVVQLVGAAGSGKTHLLRELATYAREAGALVLATTCTPDAAPLTPWRVIDRAASAATDRIAADDSGPVADTRAANGYRANGHRATKRAGARATVDADGRRIPLADSGDLVTYVSAMVDEFAGRTGWTLLVIDDLHVADRASVDVLNVLAPMLVGHPVLLVVAGRPGAQGMPPFADQVIELDGLSPDELADWIGQIEPSADATALALAGARLHAVTGGNPLAVRHALSDMGGPGRLLAADATPDLSSDPLGGLLAQLTPLEREVLVVDALYGDAGRDVSLATIVGQRPSEVREALAVARGLGLLRPDIDGAAGTHVHPAVAERLLADLGETGVREGHARIARVLEQSGAASLDFASHALAAGDLLADAERARVAEEAASEAVRQFAFADADAFYQAALDLTDDDTDVLRLLLSRAEARHRSGDLAGTSDVAAQAFRLAERLGNADAVAEAAVRYAYPPDWRAGDEAAIVMLDKAEQAQPSQARLAEVLGARAVVEMRLPVRTSGGQQWGWVTRPAVAQPLAEQALALADSSGDPLARTRAMLAWRSTHRAPEFLDRRRAMSQAALALAMQLRHLDLVVEAGSRAVVDAIEAGDRAGFDESLGLVEWAADRSRQPRLIWRAAFMDASRAGMARDVDGVQDGLRRARAAAADTFIPGAHVAEVAMTFQIAMMTGNIDGLVRMTEAPEIQMHPLGVGGVALIHALTGNTELASRLVTRAVAQLDREASYLLTSLLFGRAAAIVGDVNGAKAFLPLLDPYRDRIGIDADGFMYGGPVAGLTSALRALLADDDGAATDAEIAARLHARMGTTPANWVAPDVAPFAPALLSEREMCVLAGMARGQRNTDMAAELNYSLATIRRDTSSIFRKLDVTGRAEAVAEGYRLGLLKPQT